jgi:hypothetical protein
MTLQEQSATDREDVVVESCNEPDYAAVQVPTKPPTEYSYVERRAELLQLVQNRGHPGALNQNELADRYDVSQQQISKDLDRLDEFIRSRLAHRRDLKLGSALDRALKGALQDEEWDTVRRIAESYDEYIEGRMETLEFRRRLDRLEEAAERQQGGPRYDE